MKWNTSFSGSVKPSKQRTYVREAPLHIRNTFLGSHLSKDLRNKLKMRSLRVRKGDKVIIISGKDKGVSGTVARAFPKKGRVIVTGANVLKVHQRPRKSGEKGQIIDKSMPIDVSNVKKV